MPRAFLVVMDSVGCGGAPDAADFGDAGSNTLAHIAAAGPLALPNLASLGLGQAVELASGAQMPGMAAGTSGRWGAATEVSRGKDTPSGHWELAGVPVPWDWAYFPHEVPAFPETLTAQVCALAGVGGILGNCHASGVTIIDALGEEHLRTGWPICYTSADSVFQIAAHEEAFGLDRLLRLCADLAPTLHAMKVGRVIARPFTGVPGAFKRTANRHDYAIAPPAPTLLDWVSGAGRMTHAVGKIGDIFSMQGIAHLHKGSSDADLFDHLDRLVGVAEDGSLTFANFVEFDSLYGHRREVVGYARALEWFDGRVGALLPRLWPGDLMIFTADHGNDPTWPGTEHTRERVPVLVAGAGVGPVGLVGFVDVAASIAAHLGVLSQGPGRSFL
ncbi:MAG: phosphopentomutase [Paracoccaceae bacterium]